MPAPVPAYCANCDRWFPSAVALVDDAENVTIGDFSMICSRCGGIAPIVNGVYKAVGSTIEIVKSYDLTKDELKKLSQIFQKALYLQTPAGQLREIIKRELPQAKGFNQFLKDNPSFDFVVKTLISIIALIVAISKLSGDHQPLSKNEQLNSEKVVEEMFKSNSQTKPQQLQKPQIKQKLVTPQSGPKVGANDLCWCNSGKKQKKCHGTKRPPQKTR